MIPDFKTFIKESIWSDMQDRSAGETVRQEDLIITNEDLRNKIIELYKEQGEGETLDVSSLTNLIKCDDFSYIFSGLREVKHIIGLEDWDVSNVKNMDGMFIGCINFNSDLSKWDVSEVTDIHGMFYNCKNFNSNLSNWDVSSVKNMHSMFSGCKNFNSDLSNWDVSNVENMYGMFWGCINFNSDLSKWNVRKVKNIGDVFYNCKSLKQIPSWYMKYNQKTNESIWSDMQDRSAGETVRKEDDIDNLDCEEFFVYLTEHYQPKSKKDNEKIGGRTSITNNYIIEIPIEYIDYNMRYLIIEMSKKDNSAVSMVTSQTLFDKYVNLERMLSNNYTLNPLKNSPRVYIKSNKKPTNKSVVDLIDIFLAVVDNPILEKIS